MFKISAKYLTFLNFNTKNLIYFLKSWIFNIYFISDLNY